MNIYIALEELDPKQVIGGSTLGVSATSTVDDVNHVTLLISLFAKLTQNVQKQ